MGITASRALGVGSLALAATAVILIAEQTLETEEAGSAAVAPCSSIDVAERERPVTCSTKSATLTIADPRQPLALGDTHAEVLRARLSGRRLSVRLRLRNDTGAFQRVEAGRGQLYLRVGGDRVDFAPMVREVGAGRSVKLTARFRLKRKTARRLRRGRARAELAIVPWDELGAERPDRLGVVRLKVRSGD